MTIRVDVFAWGLASQEGLPYTVILAEDHVIICVGHPRVVEVDSFIGILGKTAAQRALEYALSKTQWAEEAGFMMINEPVRYRVDFADDVESWLYSIKAGHRDIVLGDFYSMLMKYGTPLDGDGVT